MSHRCHIGVSENGVYPPNGNPNRENNDYSDIACFEVYHTFRQTRIQIELLGPPAGCTSLRCNAPHLLQPGDGNESVTGTVGFT